MNPYLMLGSIIGTAEALSLGQRLAAWHDAIVAHERRLTTGRAIDACAEDCPHAAARGLWREAGPVFGARATALTFLRSRALGVGAAQSKIA